MKQVITLIFLFTTILCHSQSKIEGCIRDSLDKSLPDAGIMFYHSDSLIAIATSGKDGCFSLQMNSGQYVMHVMFMGYEEWVRKIELPEAGLNLQEIKLKKKSFELQEIEISADKKMHEQKLNKDIFNIPLKIKMTSADVFQVFTHIPQLKVDMINRNVSLVDNLSNIIMVNNIVRDKDYIELLKPEEIERIEIIRDPRVCDSGA
ncbi:hypothetical protein FACS1894160_4270 [Bacteroidia bacterium]|nr:hypothetical protein FACS1894160_4270 [Bacteroidia bacterium]